jgi:hypothetical protein
MCCASTFTFLPTPKKRKRKAPHNIFYEIHNTSALPCPSKQQFKTRKVLIISGVKITV